MGSRPNIAPAINEACGPETRITPIPPRPCAVATAAIVLVFDCKSLSLKTASDVPLLAYGKNIVYN